jgi:hypothetical protein
VTTEMDSAMWERLLLRAADRPAFLASRWLPVEWPALWQRLGIDKQTGLRLLVCRPPRSKRWAGDVARLARFADVDPLQLEVELLVAEARMLRARRCRPSRQAAR